MRQLVMTATSILAVFGAVGCDQAAKPGVERSKGVDTTIAAPVVEAPKAVPVAAASPEGATQAPTAASSSVEARYTPVYGACMSSGDAANGVTVAMADCISAEIETQDAKLNTAYQQVMRGLQDGPRQKLREAQRAWITFRDSKCASENQSGGTIDIINSATCILDATIRRTMELEAMESAE